MMSKMKDLTQEHFVILLLNSKNIVIKEETIYKGTLNSSVIHPREVFKAAIRAAFGSDYSFIIILLAMSHLLKKI